MCWTFEVSLGFSCLYILMNSYYLYKKPTYWKQYLLFSTFYLVMELFQTFQWLYGDVQTNTLVGISSCSTINTNFTLFANLLIWLQPIMFSVIGYQTNYRDKHYFELLILISTMVLFLSMILLYYGSDSSYYIINNSIFGNSTCTNVGDTGHLVWRFKPSNIDYYPNYLVYVILCLLSFFMYDTKEIQIIGIGWGLSLVLTKLLLGPKLLEVASSWCLMSVFANALIILSLYV
jgi:hypothetical protein